MRCVQCGSENDAGRKFCGECGAGLARACESCGTPNPPTVKFCGECGAPLTVGAPAVSAAGVAGRAEPAGAAELRVVSVLFVDLVGFTAVSESRDAEDVRELLGRYFDSARMIVERYGGSIQKFIGDAVMAVWGAPVAHEDDAERAVRAGLEMVDEVTAFGGEVGAPALRARAGVVTGQAASLAKPGEGLVVGDRVNTASRVQSIARPGTAYVDDATRQLTSAAIAYADAGQHVLKGKAEPLHLWRALRVVAGVAGSQREEGIEAPFVGRDADLRLVKELFHASVDRRAARLVALSGPAGVGKTRLRWEFFKYIDGLADTVLWHTGRCLSYGEGVAYWALVEMVAQRLGIPEGAPTEEASRKLADGLEGWVADPEEREFISPRLAALLGIAELRLGREELFAGWRLFFERLADHEPVALVFEDVHWADEGLLDFIEHLLDWSTEHPIFMLTLARPELAERRAGWPAGRRGATLLSLEPLDNGAMAELLDGVATLPDEARERIVSQAEGVPLYAIETVRALAYRGVLAERDGTLVLVGELGDLDVPATLTSLLAARLDALDPPERDLVKSMSAFGGRFPRATAAALSGAPEERLDAILAGLVRKQVLAIRADPLSPDRGQYAFAHTLLRTVAYDMLSRRERKLLHLGAAEHLRQVFPDEGEDVAEVIAAHHLDAYHAASEDPDADDLRAAALTALRRAAQRAAGVGAPETAERAYRRAIELAADEAERAELTGAAGEMALLAGRLEVALGLLEAAADLHTAAGRASDAARLARHVGQALWGLGRLEEAIKRMRGALTRTDRGGTDPDGAALRAELGRALTFADHMDAAAPILEEALWMAEALGLPDVLCEALITKGIVYFYSGRPRESQALYDAAIGIAERNGLHQQRLRAEGNAAYCAMCRDLPDTESRFQACFSTNRRLGDTFVESIDAGALMLARLLPGRWDEAQHLAEELFDRGGSERPGADHIHNGLAALEALRGNTRAARESLAHLDFWAAAENTEQRGMHGATAGSVALAEGELEQALERSAGTAHEIARLLGPHHEAVRRAWPDAWEAALALGRLDAAADLLRLLATQPPGLLPPYLAAQLARGRALLAAARGEHDTVEADFAAAIEGMRSLGYPYWLARVQIDLAEWLIDQGRTADSAPLLDEAVAALEPLRAAPALERARALIAAPAAPA